MITWTLMIYIFSIAGPRESRSIAVDHIDVANEYECRKLQSQFYADLKDKTTFYVQLNCVGPYVK